MRPWAAGPMPSGSSKLREGSPGLSPSGPVPSSSSHMRQGQDPVHVGSWLLFRTKPQEGFGWGARGPGSHWPATALCPTVCAQAWPPASEVQCEGCSRPSCHNCPVLQSLLALIPTCPVRCVFPQGGLPSLDCVFLGLVCAPPTCTVLLSLQTWHHSPWPQGRCH